MTEEEKKKWENSIKSLGDESSFSRGGKSFLEKLEEGSFKKPWAIGFLLIAFCTLVFSFWAFDTILVIFAIYCIPQILGYFLFGTSDSESGTRGGSRDR